MLNAEARRALSKLAINVFTPAMMITKLGAHTDLASALSLWYIGANVILWYVAVDACSVALVAAATQGLSP
jgi:predicted permease